MESQARTQQVTKNAWILPLYRPFIIGLLVVCGMTALLSLARAQFSPFSVQRFMNDFMGSFYVVFALPKFLGLSQFVQAFQKYDLISNKIPLYARLYPFIELALGITLIASNSMSAGNIANVAVALVSGIGLVSIAVALHSKKQVDCACLGSTFKFPLSKVTLAENVVMLAMAVYMLSTMQFSHNTMAQLTFLGASV